MAWSHLYSYDTWHSSALGGDNPFTAASPGALFDFSHWSTGKGLVAGDWVMIHLGLNGAAYDDLNGVSVTEATFAASLAYKKTMIDHILASIQAAVPGIRIGLQLIIPQSDSQDAWGVSYGTNIQKTTHADFIERYREWMIATYDANTGTGKIAGVYLAPYHCNLDTVNNMQKAAAGVNARNSAVTVQRQINAVHPDTPGYLQMSDSTYAFLKFMQ